MYVNNRYVLRPRHFLPLNYLPMPTPLKRESWSILSALATAKSIIILLPCLCKRRSRGARRSPPHRNVLRRNGIRQRAAIRRRRHSS